MWGICFGGAYGAEANSGLLQSKREFGVVNEAKRKVLFFCE